MKSFFQVKNLCYAYLKKPLCLKDVNFSAEKNDKVLLLGLDDKGKTTLLKTLSGFDDKYFGEVLLNGKEIRKIPDTEKNFSLIFDYPILLNGTIDLNLNYLFETIGKEVLLDKEKYNILKKFNLNYKLSDKIKKLSLFEKFKLCLLRVYIKSPKIIFIDDILKINFSNEEFDELFEIIEMISKDCLLIMCAGEKGFKNNSLFIEKFSWSKVLYLNNMKINEMKNLKEFYDNPIDLDALEFNEEFEIIEGYCVFQDAAYYISINDEYVVKLDKSLHASLDKLKLANLENEDIVLAYKKGMKLDFSKNNDINEMLKRGEIIIFSKLDRSRIN